MLLFNYCINMYFEFVNKDLLLLISAKSEQEICQNCEHKK